VRANQLAGIVQRSNAGGATTGLTRAGDAQTLNTKADDERDQRLPVGDDEEGVLEERDRPGDEGAEPAE